MPDNKVQVIIEDKEAFIKSIKQDVEDAKTETSSLRDNWSANRQWRMGEVGKPFPDLPFPDSSNITFRRGDQQIALWRARMTNSILRAPSLVRFMPMGSSPKAKQGSENLQLYYDWIYRYQDWKFRYTVQQSADICLEQGYTFVKITRDLSTDPKIEVVSATTLASQILQMLAAEAKMKNDNSVIREPKKEDFIRMIALIYSWDLENPIEKERAESVYDQGEEMIRGNKPDTGIEVVMDKPRMPWPKIECINQLPSLVVASGSKSIQEAQWINHTFQLTQHEIISMAEENGGPYKNVGAILEELERQSNEDGRENKIVSTTPVDEQDFKRTINEGFGLNDRNEQIGLINVSQHFCWIPRRMIKQFNNKVHGKADVMVKAVITYATDVDPQIAGPLQAIELPYNHGNWPFRQGWFRHGRDGVYSGEGIMDVVKPYEQAENIARNAAIDRTTIALSPPTFYSSFSGFNPNLHRQYTQYHAVQGDPRLVAHVMEYPNLQTQAKVDAEEFRNLAEEATGTSFLRSLLNFQTAPTAQQSALVAQPSAEIQTTEVDNFLSLWTQVFMDAYLLDRQYLFEFGNEPIRFPDIRETGNTLMLTKDDFLADYTIVAGGDATANNPVLQAQQEDRIFQALQGPFGLIISNPYEVWRDIVANAVGPAAARRWIKSREEVEQKQGEINQLIAQSQIAEQQGRSKTRKPKQAGGIFNSPRQ